MKTNSKFYVTMTDKFLSGWGMAENKACKLVIVCDNWVQAETIKRNAEKRTDMKYINICLKKPTYKNAVVTEKHFSELGEIWTKN